MKGFILNSETRFLEENEFDEMVFYGVLEDGRNFQWIEPRPYFLGFLPIEKDVAGNDIVNTLSEIYRESSGFKDFRGVDHKAVFFSSRSALNVARKSLADSLPQQQLLSGSEIILESSVSPTTQFLISRGIRGGVEFLSEPAEPTFDLASEMAVKTPAEARSDLVTYISPRFAPAVFLPDLRVLSFDIETGAEEDLLYSISMVCGTYEKVLMLTDNLDSPCPAKTEWVNSEKEMLQRFCEEVQMLNPHVFTGWFVVGFDFRYLIRKATENQVQLPLGIGKKESDRFVQAFKKRNNEFSLFIPGRIIIDGMEATELILTERPENMKLDTVANTLLGVGKTIESSGVEKINEITRMFYKDKAKLSEYNLIDSRLVCEILLKLEALPYYLLRASFSFSSMERLGSSGEVFQNNYLAQLHKKKLVGFSQEMQNVNLPAFRFEKKTKGGVYKNVMVFSLADLYVVSILSNQIDPMGIAMATANEDEALRSPKGYLRHKDVNILGEMLEGLLKKKSEASTFIEKKAIGGEIKALAKGLLVKENRFFLSYIRNTLQKEAHEIASELSLELEKVGYKIIFFNDRQLFLQLSEQDLPIEEQLIHKEKILKIAHTFLVKISAREIDLRLLQVENFFVSFFLPSQDHNIVRSYYLRYTGIDKIGKLHFRSISKNALRLCRYFERELLKEIFNGYDVEAFLKIFRRKLLMGEYDEKLIYKAKLNKSIDEYTGGQKHSAMVEAALKIKDQIKLFELRGEKISFYYYVSKEGSQPLGDFEKGINVVDENLIKKAVFDYEFYLEEEIIPVAKKVLETTGQENLLSSLTGKEKQLDLF